MDRSIASVASLKYPACQSLLVDEGVVIWIGLFSVQDASYMCLNFKKCATCKMGTLIKIDITPLRNVQIISELFSSKLERVLVKDAMSDFWPQTLKKRFFE